MIFGKKRPLLIYLTETTLRLYRGEEQLKTVTLPEKNVSRGNLAKLFEEEVGSYLRNEEVLLVLGGKLLFQKAYVLSDERVGEEDKEAFYKDLPISERDLARNTITTEHKVYLLGTNKIYYEAVVDTAGVVSAVLPLSLFSDDTTTDELTREQREDIYNHTSLYEVGDFLSDNPYSPMEKESRTPAKDEFLPREQIVVTESSFNVGVLVKLVLVSLLLAALFFAGFVYMDHSTSNPQESVNESVVIPTPSVAEESSAVKKSELTIQVLNGTGTAGQAGMVEELLIKAEFSHITVGNAEEQNHDVTEVVVSDKVSPEIKTELQEVLESAFTDVKIAEDEKDSEFDIIITTGTPKE